jgi:hypothetical protein
VKVWGVLAEGRVSTLGRDVLERRTREAKKEEERKEDALQKVEEAKDANARSTLEVMDRHNEMVKKSQELYKEKARRRAVELQDMKRREEHSVLLAEMAVRNAERRDFFKERV